MEVYIYIRIYIKLRNVAKFFFFFGNFLVKNVLEFFIVEIA